MTGSRSAKPNIGVFRRWPAGLEAMQSVDELCNSAGLSKDLLSLIRLQCSVSNICCFCIAMHRHEALGAGVSAKLIDDLIGQEQNIAMPDKWLAALRLSIALTKIHSPDEIAKAVDGVRQYYSADQITVLLYGIAQINAWNRLAIADGLTAQHFTTRSE